MAVWIDFISCGICQPIPLKVWPTNPDTRLQPSNHLAWRLVTDLEMFSCSGTNVLPHYFMKARVSSSHSGCRTLCGWIQNHTAVYHYTTTAARFWFDSTTWLRWCNDDASISNWQAVSSQCRFAWPRGCQEKHFGGLQKIQNDVMLVYMTKTPHTGERLYKAKSLYRLEHWLPVKERIDLLTCYQL